MVRQTANPAIETPSYQLCASYLQHGQCSVGIVSLAISEQSVAIFDFGDEHIDHKYSKDVEDSKCECSCANDVQVVFKPRK